MSRLFFTLLFVLAPLSWGNPPAAAPAQCTASGEAPPIVGPGYSDPKFCCKGNIIIVQKVACQKPYGGFAGICAPCGNGSCESQWEDKCNCPEDCLKVAPQKKLPAQKKK